MKFFGKPGCCEYFHTWGSGKESPICDGHRGTFQAQCCKKINRVDEERASFHRYYTHREWGKAEEYEVCLDSGVLGVDRSVEAILGYLKIRGLI